MMVIEEGDDGEQLTGRRMTQRRPRRKEEKKKKRTGKERGRLEEDINWKGKLPNRSSKFHLTFVSKYNNNKYNTTLIHNHLFQ